MYIDYLLFYTRYIIHKNNILQNFVIVSALF